MGKKKSISIEDFLKKTCGVTVNANAQKIIKECDDWYSNKETDFHKKVNVNGVSYTIDSLNFAKRCCEDDANLCELVEVNAGYNEQQYDEINAILKRNRFGRMYRKQLERVSADGTVGAYMSLVNVKGIEEGETPIVTSADAKLNYCYADGIFPITIENDDIIECAFYGQNTVKGAKEDVCVVFLLGDDGKYTADSYYFVNGVEDANRRTHFTLGEVKPFAIMRTAQVNNIDDMDGYGYPKLYTAIPVLKCLDLAFYILFGDLDKGEKLVFINELLACISKGADGKSYLTQQQKELFVLLGEKLPTQNNIIYEYNPELRIKEMTEIFETLLSILSMSFGFGTKKYTFENGQIKTASEYIGERQDCMQEVNKQRVEATDYIESIVKMIMWSENEFNNGNYDLDNAEIHIDFDDSYVEDKPSQIERERNDALSFDIPELKVKYLMDAYNYDEEEAKRLVYRTEEEQLNEDTNDANTGEEE